MITVIFGVLTLVSGLALLLFSTGITYLDLKDKALADEYRQKYGYWLTRSALAIIVCGIVLMLSPFISNG